MKAFGMEFFIDNIFWLAIGGVILFVMFRSRGSKHNGLPKQHVSTTTTTITITNSDPIFEELMQHIREGRKVEAIKLLRAEKDLELVAAKAVVEALEQHGDTVQ